MEIKLNSLKLQNFKGIRDFELILNGLNISVLGANGTGKTTLADSFQWILFDKDSTNRKDFSIKTHDAQGQEIHGLEHEVEAVLSVDGKPITLRKMLSEKWTKKRGEAEREFTGHETSYWVDDVPSKKSEYTAKINALIDENIFKLITNPLYFSDDKLFSWEKRRKALMEICPEASAVQDIDIIRSNPELEKLEGILNGKSTDDYKKILAEQIKKLNKEIEKIPVRIDELMKSMGDEQDYSAVEASLRHYKDQLKAIEWELTNASKSAQELRQKQQELYKIQDAIEARKRELADKANAGFKQIVDEKSQLQNQKFKLDSEARSADNLTLTKGHLIERLGSEMASLREQWKDEYAKTFAHSDDQDFVCPTCKRPFEQDYIEKQIDTLKANFEQNKAKTLQVINEKGKSLATQKTEAQDEIAKASDAFLKLEAQLHDINERIAEIDEELANEKPVAANYEQDHQYQDLTQQYNALKSELDKPVEDITKDLLAKKITITQQIEDINRILNQKEVTEHTKERIQELKDEERTLAGQISELEGHRYLVEQFIKSKVNLLEDSINSRFKAVRFKLFDTQINGGVVECCETLVNTNGAWVGWADTNNAGRVNAGLDIINTLSKHYGVSAPIFLDNRESVNNLIETESQIINLVVTQDPKLRVEVA